MNLLGITGAVAGLLTLVCYASTTWFRSGRISKSVARDRQSTRAPKRSTTRKILLSLSALALAGSMAGLGTFAAYTSTTSASNSVTSGVVSIALGSVNRVSIAATGVLPGDTISRAVDLTSSSTDALASVKLATTAPTTSSALNTDATNGLQLLVQRCSTAWSETANTAPQTGYTYATCAGATTVFVGATTAVIQPATALSSLNATSGPGNITPTVDHLLITMTLPSGTTEVQVPQNSASVIVFTFTATQRSGPTPR